MESDQDSVRTLKGIGDKTGKLFEKLGIFTIQDLLGYYPREYHVYEEPSPIGDLKADMAGAAAGVLQKSASVRAFQNKKVITASLRDETGTLQLTWFNMPFLKNTLQAGTYHVFYGKVVKKNNRLTMEQPEIFTREGYQAMMESMQPVYGQTKGLGNKAITKAVARALLRRQMEREYLPAYIRKKYELAEYNFALEHIHFPENRQQLLFARKRLVFDEFFLFILAVRRLKEKRQDRKSAWVMKAAPQVAKLMEDLPYDLTRAQRKVLDEIMEDMAGGLVMNRLVQGDVGSGKTVIAIMALLTAAYNGCQGAMMAPTEVLARQHYEGMRRMFADCGIDKVPVLLTGSMTAKEKRMAYEKIKSHEADIIVGTHALIQDKVVYDRLALVITDEQHRFGVGQRQIFGDKGQEPHVLVMSATPIPRTLAIILYGDLDISVIDQMPSDRLPVKNCVVGTSYRPNAYSFIRKQVEQGRQAYVICPMVEYSEMMEAENVLDYTKILREALPGIAVDFLHGKMKGKEKNEIMERFAANEIQVLVSTTVVEVGVNVPNATVMMIENAERFGLAQLHQLRGRVGRGKHQSYCILVNCGDQEGTSERLDILNRSNDGFYIASEDLKLRGPGDIFGIRQSGDMEFKLADIFTDANLLKTVSQEVDRLLEADRDLVCPEHQELGKRLGKYLESSYDKVNL
jgi:ATP-dependent DNA helicase RecG